MPASLLASMMPWRQILRSCADAPPASAAVTASIAENRTTLERLQHIMRALLWFSLFPHPCGKTFNDPAHAGTIADFIVPRGDGGKISPKGTCFAAALSPAHAGTIQAQFRFS